MTAAGGAQAPGWTVAERMMLTYLALTAIIGLTRIAEQPAIGWVLGAYLLAAGVIVSLSRARLSRWGTNLRIGAPILLLMALYPALDILNRFGNVAVHDVAVRHWEHLLFGGDISQTWWRAMPSRFWSTVLHGAYFAYYPLVLAPVVVFLWQGRQDDAGRSVRWLLSGFLSCYLIFLLYPVAGPYYEFPRPDPWFLDNPMARLVYATLDRGSAYGAAFPSSHVAGTLIALGAGYRGSRALGHLMLVPSLLLCVGVVYCQMHYAVDAVAGVALAGAVVGGWSWWEAKVAVASQSQQS